MGGLQEQLDLAEVALRQRATDAGPQVIAEPVGRRRRDHERLLGRRPGPLLGRVVVVIIRQQVEVLAEIAPELLLAAQAEDVQVVELDLVRLRDSDAARVEPAAAALALWLAHPS